jgi:hypothetical protein
MLESCTIGQSRIPLYPGEEKLKCFDCRVNYPQMDFSGTGKLHVTNFKLHFQSDPFDSPPTSISIPLNCILSVVEPVKPSYWSVYQTDPLCQDLQITTKDVRTLTLTFDNDENRQSAQQFITQRAFWGGSKTDMANFLFAFSYKRDTLPSPEDRFSRNSCWYNTEEEFERFGLREYYQF